MVTYRGDALLRAHPHLERSETMKEIFPHDRTTHLDFQAHSKPTHGDEFPSYTPSPALGHRPIQPTPSTRQRKGHSSDLRKSKKIRLLTWSRLKAPTEFMSSSSICMSTECCSVLCNSEALPAHLLSKLSCEISHGHDGSFMKRGSL